MKIEKLPSGSYRVRKMYKGNNYALVFDHKPTPKEVTIKLAEKMETQETTETRKTGSFGDAIDSYIKDRKNVLSPSTAKSYKDLKNAYSKDFLNKNVYDITQDDIQKETNRYAEKHAPKTVRNFHGLISTVMGYKRPSFKINTTLPEKEDKEAVIPETDDVSKILDYVKGTEYYVPIYLGCHGLRRSEIIALTMEDLEGNVLTIKKGRVINPDNEYVAKTTKSFSGYRKLVIANELADAIREKGYIYKGHPGNILRTLHRTQDRLGLERCKLHELRHFYVSFAHDLGMSDANIIYSIGHKSDAIMKRIYRHKMREAEAQTLVAEAINFSKKDS